MTITKERMTCQCGHVFDAEIVTNAPIDVSVASMKAVRCPACGGHKCSFGGAYKDHPDSSSTVTERAAWWIERGATGTSSLTFYCFFTGRGTSPHREFYWPLDPDDFSRCRALFDLIPEWRADIAKVTERFPWMQPFIDRWDEFDRLWDEESRKKRCPKLYAEMQKACAEAQALRPRRL